MSLGALRLLAMWLVGSIAILGPTIGSGGMARAEGLGQPPPIPTSGFGHVDRSGMYEHVVRGATEGFIVGLSIGFAASSNGEAGSRVGAGAVLGTAAGIVLPLALNRGGKEVRTGDVIFLNVAQDVGFAHGLLLPMLFQYADGNTLSRDELRLDLGLAAGVSLAAGAIAAARAAEVDFTPGQAAALGSAAFWGGAAGALIVGTLAPVNSGRGWDRAAIGAGLGLADAAVLTAWVNRATFDVDRSRVTLMNLGGFAGLAVGVAAAYFIDPNLNNHRAITASLLVGAGVGVASGYYLSDGWDDFKRSAPASGASGLSLLELRRGRWTVGVPLPRPLAVASARGDVRLRPLLSLADGRF